MVGPRATGGFGRFFLSAGHRSSDLCAPLRHRQLTESGLLDQFEVKVAIGVAGP